LSLNNTEKYKFFNIFGNEIYNQQIHSLNNQDILFYTLASILNRLKV